jgi:zinc and cadmium transporter
MALTATTGIILGGLAMSLIALSGSLTLLLRPATLQRLLLPMVSFAAGSLLGGALLHMVPAGLSAGISPILSGLLVLAGFTVFLLLEQGLHAHHCLRAGADCRRPLGTLILLGDGLHNLLGGLAVGGAFLIDVRVGLTAWFAAAAHEVPQEFGDFAVLLHSGLSRGRALILNWLSGITFLVGGLIALGLSGRAPVELLVPFAAGNFIYIGAVDLIPEVSRQGDIHDGVVHILAFLAGVAVLALPLAWPAH